MTTELPADSSGEEMIKAVIPDVHSCADCSTIAEEKDCTIMTDGVTEYWLCNTCANSVKTWTNIYVEKFPWNAKK